MAPYRLSICFITSFLGVGPLEIFLAPHAHKASNFATGTVQGEPQTCLDHIQLSACTSSRSHFQNFLRLRLQGWTLVNPLVNPLPPAKILPMPLAVGTSTDIFSVRLPFSLPLLPH